MDALDQTDLLDKVRQLATLKEVLEGVFEHLGTELLHALEPPEAGAPTPAIPAPAIDPESAERIDDALRQIRALLAE